jgi:putative transcriptional regulator
MKGGKDYESLSVFEQIREGLRDNIAQARGGRGGGGLTLKTTTLPSPAPRLSKARVSAIRRKTGMSQAVFASYLNVPKKTLQSWEQGARAPKAGEARLLQIFAVAPRELESLVIKADQKVSGTRPRRSPRRPATAA